jgi:hypothetical protein
MDNLLQHLKDTGIDLPENFTDYQLRILCEVVVRHCEQYVGDNLWAEPGDLLSYYELEKR